MSTLKNKIEYLNKEFKNGSPALDGQNSLLFLNDILEEMSSDFDNYNENKDSIGNLYSACMTELNIAPLETKTILLNNVLKSIGADSAIKDDLSTKSPIFKDFLIEKSDKEIFKEINEIFKHSFDSKYKRIEVDALLSTLDSYLSKNPKNELLSKFVESEEFTDFNVAEIMAASLVLKEFSDNEVYTLTENQKVTLNNLVININNVKVNNQKFSDLIDTEIEVYNKYMFFNSLNTEAQLHEMNKKQKLEDSNGFISNHPIEESLQDTLTANENRRNNPIIDVNSIQWEKKYKDYLNSLNTSESSVKIMSSSDKFKAKFASHGFAPATASLFGDSIVLADKFGDPQRTMWNISALTGTMRLSRDVDYSDPKITAQAFTIAALNARRNNWGTVYLNHPGPDIEAKHFMESSISAMIDVGNYDFDDIKVPRKYKHVLEYMKSKYAVIENGVNVKNDLSESIPIGEETENTATNKQTNNSSEVIPVSDENENTTTNKQTNNSSEVIPISDENDGLEFNIDEFESDNDIFNDVQNRSEPIINSTTEYNVEDDLTPPNFVTEDIGNIDYEYPDVGDLSLGDYDKNDQKDEVLSENNEKSIKPKSDVKITSVNVDPEIENLSKDFENIKNTKSKPEKPKLFKNKP